MIAIAAYLATTTFLAGVAATGFITVCKNIAQKEFQR